MYIEAKLLISVASLIRKLTCPSVDKGMLLPKLLLTCNILEIP